MFEEFYKKYIPDDQEIIVLVRNFLGAVYRHGFWQMEVALLGIVLCSTGEIRIQDGRLAWPAAEEDPNSVLDWHRFQPGQICRVLARPLQDKDVPVGFPPEKFNGWCLTRVLEPEVSCPPLETVYKEYSRPVFLEDKILGTLELNKDLDFLETYIFWNGKEISLLLEVNSRNQAAWSQARTTATQLVTDQQSWDKTLRNFAAHKLTPLANAWRGHTLDGINSPPIPEESFRKRLQLTEILVAPDGLFTAYYDDNNLFWGQAVEVSGSLEQGPIRADLSD